METSQQTDGEVKVSRPRSPNPLCARKGCNHTASLHGNPRTNCKAVGCRCVDFRPKGVRVSA